VEAVGTTAVEVRVDCRERRERNEKKENRM
jgi:hypothetical protein